MLRQLKVNLLFVSCLGALVIGVLAVTFGQPHAALVVAIAGALVGGLCGVMRDLVAPPPNPAVPASVVAQIIGGSPAGLDDDLAASPFRINLLIVALIAALVVIFLAVFFGAESATLVTAVAGALVGGLCGVMRELIAPPPNPDVPASVVAQIIEAKSGS